MDVRGVTARTAVVAVALGTVLAITATQAAAETDHDGCSAAWAGVDRAQSRLESADPDYWFTWAGPQAPVLDRQPRIDWTSHRLLASGFTSISRYC